MSNALTVQGSQLSATERGGDTEDRLEGILSRYEGKRDELIPALQEVQQVLGYLPEPAMRTIARFFRLPESTVFAVATFYAQFKLTPSGRNIVRVCRGTACHVRGGPRILREVQRHLGIKPGESSPDLEYSLETVACIGACALAPTMVINDKTHGQLQAGRVAELLELSGGRT